MQWDSPLFGHVQWQTTNEASETADALWNSLSLTKHQHERLSLFQEEVRVAQKETY